MSPASRAKGKRRGRAILLFVLFALAAAVAAYVLTVSRADGVAAETMRSARTQKGMYAFGNADAETGLILYPGGKVAYTAYAPLAKSIADAAGILVVVPKMPLNLAVLGENAADDVMAAYPAVNDWKIGGHSLGGAVAASYAAKNRDAVSGVLLLAAYATEPLSAPALSIYGDRDTVLHREKYEACRVNLPQETMEIVIPGGNHANFGNYGAQKGDQMTEISAVEQQRIVTESVCDWLAGVMRLEDVA